MEALNVGGRGGGPEAKVRAAAGVEAHRDAAGAVDVVAAHPDAAAVAAAVAAAAAAAAEVEAEAEAEAATEIEIEAVCGMAGRRSPRKTLAGSARLPTTTTLSTERTDRSS